MRLSEIPRVWSLLEGAKGEPLHPLDLRRIIMPSHAKKLIHLDSFETINHLDPVGPVGPRLSVIRVPGQQKVHFGGMCFFQGSRQLPKQQA